MTTLTRPFTPLAHRGPRSAERVVPLPTVSAVHHALLRPGARLVDALDEAVTAAGATSGQVELLDGTLATVSYCFPGEGRPGGPLVGYCPAREATGPVRVVGGSATVGRRAGARFIHCHAAWFDAEGDLAGGHLWPETHVGPAGLHAVVHALRDVELTSADDPESGLPVFTPERRHRGGEAASSGPSAPGAQTRPAVMVRVCAGENLLEVCAAIMEDHGMAEASISGSLGSLVGAALARPAGLLVVDGPATEVTLSGRLRLAGGALTHHLPAIVIDRHGRVHTGLLTDQNIVAVTVELLVEGLR
ncbi:PCC domain-containing protein [Nocardioides alkalitolerans]|uniref:PCC domain-containing protein n=1 Tax=Nocardioides alkalitolerans TaxID=281714 RepID=UPI00048DF1DC|nr:DUF296 domain-containing protein [Nocardioides alkalitolerans]